MDTRRYSKAESSQFQLFSLGRFHRLFNLDFQRLRVLAFIIFLSILIPLKQKKERWKMQDRWLSNNKIIYGSVQLILTLSFFFLLKREVQQLKFTILSWCAGLKKIIILHLCWYCPPFRLLSFMLFLLTSLMADTWTMVEKSSVKVDYMGNCPPLESKVSHNQREGVKLLTGSNSNTSIDSKNKDQRLHWTEKMPELWSQQLLSGSFTEQRSFKNSPGYIRKNEENPIWENYITA